MKKIAQIFILILLFISFLGLLTLYTLNDFMIGAELSIVIIVSMIFVFIILYLIDKIFNL